MTLQFHYPWVLFLLWLVPVAGIGWHWLASRKSAEKAFVSPLMAARLAPAASPVRQFWQRTLFMAGLLLALIAAARPQWGMKEDTVYQRGRDLMIVLDVSRSMLANDVHPSRLGRAKVDLIDLIRQLRGDRVGLLAFRGRPLLLCPLTTDYGFLSQTLEGAAVDSAPAGETDIGDAVLEALNNFQGDEGSHRAIVLVSDGEDLAGKVTEAIAKAKEQGVALFTVGFGSTAGASVPSAANKKEAMNYQGQEVVSKLNHEVLRDLAEKTGGAYVPVGLANVKLGDLYRNHLSRINARDLEESVQRRAIDRYQWFLFPAALCFIGLAFFSRGQVRVQKGVFSVQYSEVRSQESEARSQNRESRVQSPESRIQSPESPTPPPVPQAMVLLLLLSGIWGGDTVLAQTNLPAGREGARVAQKLYLTGQYAESAEAYQAAAKTAATANRDDYLFNAGCALLKAGKPDDAADLFRNLTGIEGARGAAAAYNLGCSQLQSADSTNTEHRVQSLKQAGLAFQKVLQQNSTSRDALKNLAITASLTPEAEDQARISRLMAEHGQSQPGALADTMLLQQRKLVEGIPAAFTNTTPTLIESLESLATAQDQTTELMIPLKGKLLQALSQQAQQGGPSTNAQQQIAQVNAFAEAIRDQLSGISSSLRDLDRSAIPLSEKAEASLYTLWKGLAGYPQLLREDIQRQTNAITLNEKPSGWTATSGRGQTPPGGRRPPSGSLDSVETQQAEALDLTGLFKERFEQTVPPEGISRPVQQASTNEPTGTNTTEQVLSPEDRQKIVTLAGQAITAQTAARDAAANLATSLPHQRKAYGLLKEIEKLLPKEKQPQNNQQQKQDQPQKQDPKDQPKDQPKEQPKEQKQPPEKQEPKKDPLSQEDLKRMLEKAKQREKEHEQELRDRNNDIPLSPAERDW